MIFHWQSGDFFHRKKLGENLSADQAEAIRLSTTLRKKVEIQEGSFQCQRVTEI